MLNQSPTSHCVCTALTNQSIVHHSRTSLPLSLTLFPSRHPTLENIRLWRRRRRLRRLLLLLLLLAGIKTSGWLCGCYVRRISIYLSSTFFKLRRKSTPDTAEKAKIRRRDGSGKSVRKTENRELGRKHKYFSKLHYFYPTVAVRYTGICPRI